ncbi:MAG TPA: sensor domain-containing diguanylate cyclase [Candidatus Acidoferrales bacterium]|nr:sensor domain-containing diguanylate cyclase [Candidatus Acidoferrales bacterium]
MSPRKPKTGKGGRRPAKGRPGHAPAERAPLAARVGDAPHDFVHDIAKALTSTLQLDQVLKTIMEKVNELMSPDTWSLLLVDEKTNELYFQVATGAAADKLKEVRLKMGEGIAGWVAQTGQSAVVPDVQKDKRFAGHVDEITNILTRSIICVPIRTKDRVLGVIEIINYVGKRDFGPEDVALLQAMADYAAIALENAIHVQRIHELTITDDVTSLYNARHLNFVLETEIYRSNRYHYEFSLVFLDLDHFKEVNDTYGHLIGSKLLCELADAIRGSLRMIDYAFRYGGDEFVVLLPQTGREAATVVARRLRQRLNDTRFMVAEGLNLHVTASLGLATFPLDATTKAEMIRLADEAMYLVKNTSRNNIAVANQGLLV